MQTKSAGELQTAGTTPKSRFRRADIPPFSLLPAAEPVREMLTIHAYRTTKPISPVGPGRTTQNA